MIAALMTSLLLCAAPADAVAPSLLPHASEWAQVQGSGAVVVGERSDGKWHYALGGSPFANGRPAVAPEQIEFEIGSISKVFTGLLLAHAVHEGKLALDDTLGQRLPLKFDQAQLAAITLKQLATHTSCLPRLPDNLVDASGADPYANYDDRALFEFLAHARLQANAPCKADYSNLGFGILGVVLERIYHKPWAALIAEKITGPLSMPDTVQVLSSAQQARFATAWDGNVQVAPWTFKSIAGAGALRSTAADLARFADAMLAGAEGPLKDVWPIFAGDYVEMPMLAGRIGLGLIHGTQDGQDSYWHNGGTGGYRSDLRVSKQTGTASIVLASNARALPEAWIAAAHKPAATAPAATEVALDPATLDAYAGVYPLAPQARLTVLHVGDGLRVRLTGQTFLPVYASQKDQFFYKVVDAQLRFQRDARGTVNAVTLHQNGRDMKAERSAEALPQIRFPAAAALAEFAGNYDFSAFQPGATITVKANGDTLGAQLTGQQMLPIHCTGDDRFEWDVVAAALSFERDAQHHIVAAVLHQNGADMRAPRM